MTNPHSFYRDGRFQVTSADVQTPSMIYPIGESVIGRIRKDIQVGGLGVAALFAAALAVYWDLWFWHEVYAMAGVMILAILVSLSFSVLQIEARGYPPRLFIARRHVVKRIFSAIAEARASNGPAATHHFLSEDPE